MIPHIMILHDMISPDMNRVTTSSLPHSAPESTRSLKLADRIGIALSGLCMVHCLLLPMLVPFLTTIAVFVESEYTHAILALCIIPTVGFAAWRGYAKHGKQIVIWLLASGTLAVVIAMLAGEQFANNVLEAGITTLGSILLIAGHWQNHKHRTVCTSDVPHSH